MPKIGLTDDGFYEQQLVQQQVIQLTGQNLLTGYASNQAEYQDLMNAGVTYAQQMNLVPGVALTAAQMAQLTSNMVWLVSQTVTLPDGTKQSVLVPQVYLKVQSGDLNGGGGLLAGAQVNLNVAGNLMNTGTVAGAQNVNLVAQNLNNLGGLINGNSVAVSATQDLNNIGGQINAVNSLTAAAGRDLNVVTTTTSSSNANGGRTVIDQTGSLNVTGSGGTLTASAGRDVNVTAGVVQNTGQNGQTTIVAANNLNLGTVTTASSNNIVWDGGNHRSDSSTTDVGSQINAAGNVTLGAGNDLNAVAATVNATGAISASANNNINIVAGQSTQSVDEAHQHVTSEGMFSSTTTSTRDTLKQTNALASTLSGNMIDLLAGKNITVNGSNVAGTNDVNVSAVGDVSILAATNTFMQNSFSQKTTSGLFGSGGFGFTIGTKVQTDQDATNGTTQSQSRSLVGSINGNLNIQSGGNVTVSSSDLTAQQDINITGKSIAFNPGVDQTQDTETHSLTQSGLTVAVTSPIISAIQAAQQVVQASKQTSDPRVQALAAATLGMAAYNADQAVQSAANAISSGKGSTGIGISATIGSSSSQSQTVTNSTQNTGATATAGNNLNLTATGAGAQSTINVVGSQLSAGNIANLNADGAINLVAAQNSTTQTTTNSSSSAGVGVAMEIGSNGLAFGITANASEGHGNANGNGTQQANTSITAVNQVNLTSGSDTTLNGATVAAKDVTANVGGNLTIQSVQETSTYNSNNQSMGGSLTVGLGTGVAGSISYSQQNMHNNYASVNQQSGIQAGDGGFQVNVQGNTALNGGVIASTQAAVDQNLNSLTTGTLTQSAIQNVAQYSADSIGLSAGGAIGSASTTQNQNPPGTQPSSAVPSSDGQGYQIGSVDFKTGTTIAAPIALSASGNSSSTTTSGISGGRITITN